MKIAVVGASGRMGQSVIKELIENDLTDISGALVRSDSQLLGIDIGELVGSDKLGIQASNDLEKIFLEAEAIIDFSYPKLTMDCFKLASKHRKILISGTTGLSNEEKKQMINYANNSAIIWSANMSIGINLLVNLSEKIAKILHDDYDAEILEFHHNQKTDAPSGTAILLGEAIAKGRNLNFGEVFRKNRDGIIGKREKNEIGFCSLRGGDVIGEHSVIFAGNGERIELSHKASNRDIYAKGAVRATIWASAQKPGLYSMRDVLSGIY